MFNVYSVKKTYNTTKQDKTYLQHIFLDIQHVPCYKSKMTILQLLNANNWKFRLLLKTKPLLSFKFAWPYHLTMLLLHFFFLAYIAFTVSLLVYIRYGHFVATEALFHPSWAFLRISKRNPFSVKGLEDDTVHPFLCYIVLPRIYDNHTCWQAFEIGIL